MRADSKSPKMTDGLTVFFALLGSARLKAASNRLMKLTPWADAIKKFTPSLGIPYLRV